MAESIAMEYKHYRDGIEKARLSGMIFDAPEKGSNGPRDIFNHLPKCFQLWLIFDIISL